MFKFEESIKPHKAVFFGYRNIKIPVLAGAGISLWFFSVNREVPQLFITLGLIAVASLIVFLITAGSAKLAYSSTSLRRAIFIPLIISLIITLIYCLIFLTQDSSGAGALVIGAALMIGFFIFGPLNISLFLIALNEYKKMKAENIEAKNYTVIDLNKL